MTVYKRKKNKLVLVKKPSDYIYITYGIHPKNIGQAFAYNLALDEEISILALTGRAGTGKTLLALSAGLSMLEEKKFSKIVIFRPTIEVEDSIGYLPEDIQGKLMPRIQPIINNLKLIIEKSTTKKKNQNKVKTKIDEIIKSGNQNKAETKIDEIIKSGIIEMMPINFIRGETLHNSFVIVDEAQNFTPHGIKTIITRIGEGSKVILTGDLSQIDHQYLDPSSSGLTKLISVFDGKEFFARLYLQKGERSKLAEEASKLL